MRDHRLGGQFGPEADLVVNRRRVTRSDAAYLSEADLRRQEDANARGGRKGNFKYGRLLVPPTLIIESLSLGHEAHDRETKFRWYAEFGVSHYWLLDARSRSLECFVLDAGAYRLEASGPGDEVVASTVFAGLVIPLRQLWA